MSAMKRSSGILLHISSLPSRYGIGNLGKAAYDFVDFLKKAKQTYWQILPICPPGYGDSPYQAFSTFAGNPYFIDPDQLIEAGYLMQAEADAVAWGERDDQVNYRTMYDRRQALLRKAFVRFMKSPPADFAAYVRDEAWWLEEYALFMAVKAHFGDGPWTAWEPDIRLHQPQAIEHYRTLLQEDIQYHYFVQYCFANQWRRLRDYAHENGVKIIGDIPIYVPLDSADVWSHPENFQLNRNRRPRCVAGCPPDGFNANGQYWGNPIYDWDKMENDGFTWWLARIGAAGRNFDVVRIDHFRGLESYWSIPAVNHTARCGQWIKGPGMKLINAIKTAYPQMDFIAEDLGFLTPEVVQLVADSGFPSMKVLEFAFDPREPSNYLPHKYGENCICYTGTHDNETLYQWYYGLSDECKQYARSYLKIGEDDDLPRAIIRAGMASNAKLFVAQMQDYLGLGGEARMNVPGILQPENWRWRMTREQQSKALAQEIASLTEQYDRV
ncbi:MAG: 4-alpha-glucanotransferase [Oscillospiraceae bacterium]